MSRHPSDPPARAILGIAIPASLRPPASAQPRKLVARHERVVRGGRVVATPCPNGAVRIVGLNEAGEWIAEFACREEHFDERFIRRMEQHVAEKTGVRIAVVG